MRAERVRQVLKQSGNFSQIILAFEKSQSREGVEQFRRERGGGAAIDGFKFLVEEINDPQAG
jgi:hypothetical protein